MAPLLEVTDLRVELRSRGKTVKAVNGVSFALDQGETLGLVGESGCGKSMTALSLMRLIPSPQGRIVGGHARFDGRDLLALSENEIRQVRGNSIAMVFQDPMTSLNPVLPIGKQIGEALGVHLGMGRTAARKRTVELLEQVGMPSAKLRIDDYPFQFSGGMRQRVMIAMALSCEPRLLIADEPTTALDVTVQAQILELLKRLQSELGMAMILITHDLGVMAGVADRVCVMYAGAIVETSGVDEVFRTPRHPYTLGLLRSIPNVVRGQRQRLVPIDGQPPDLADLPPGCPFQPRCQFRVEKCAGENPEIEEVVQGHSIACWVDVTGGDRHSRRSRGPRLAVAG
jgi:oligopeptide transport system ATP-binding protein